ncbi:NEW3 domain-containing protein [Jiangella gansuensis]|uniref:COG1470 family protein n=1 Tax=Jiangella gansuensis TaxID=281473 RepID=UPI003CCC4633
MTGRLLDWLDRQRTAGELPADTAEALAAAVGAVHGELSSASALITGVAVTVAPPADGSVVAGGAAEVGVTVTNSGEHRVQGVQAVVTAPEGWTVTPAGPDRVGSLPPGETFTVRFSVAAPLSQPVAAAVPITATASYLHAGGRVELSAPATLDVLSPVTLGDVAADPRIIDEPGTPSTVTAVVTNRAAQPVDSTVRAAVPEGWSVEPASVAYQLAAGEHAEVSFRVVPPAEPAAGDVTLTAGYGDHDGATATVRLTHSLAGWLFDTDGDAEGWEPGNHLTEPEVSGGVLRVTSTGGDPYLVSSTPLSIDAADGVVVEVTMQVAADSGAQLFWTSAAEPFFSEGKSTKFPVTAGEPRTYRVPVRGFDGTLTGLRLDPLERDGDVVIDAIRIVR